MKSLYLSILFSALVGFSSLHAASVIIISDGAQAHLSDLLTSCGHTVTVSSNFGDADTSAPGTLGFNALSAADLVIVARNTNSGDYDANVAAWDAITTPILLLNAFLARDSRWKWTTGEGLSTNTTPIITPPNASAASHPLYTGLTSGGTSAVTSQPFYTTSSQNIDLPSSSFTANATVLGVQNSATTTFSAFFAAGSTTGSGNVLAEDRMFLGFPATSSNSNANGDQLFKNAVAFLVPEPSRAVLLAMGLFFMLTRRSR